MTIPNQFFPFIAAIGLLSVCGCTKVSDRSDEHPSPEFQTVIAEWNGGQMTLGEWLHTFRETKNPLSINQMKLNYDILQLTHNWVAEKMLWTNARAGGIDRDPGYLDRISPIREQSLLRLYIRRHVDEVINIKKKDLERYYKENHQEFMTHARYSYYRIFISNEEHGQEEALRRAKECWGFLENGISFHDMVLEYSDSKTKNRDKLFGPFSMGDNRVEIEDAIRQTPVGGYSPIVELQNGYAIFYPESKSESVLRPLSQAKDTIYKKLFDRGREERYGQLILDLTEKKYKVASHDELLDDPNAAEEDTIFELQPGDAKWTLGDYRQFVLGSRGGEEGSLAATLEGFRQRMLFLHDARRTGFDESAYFKDRFHPLEKRILSDYLLEINVDLNAEVTEEEVEAYYDENHEEFRRPTSVEAWHLVRNIEYLPGASQRDRVVAEKKVFEDLLGVRNLIAFQGHSFVTWADRFSVSEDGGYMGWVVMADLPPAWVSEVAKLEEGEISMPFRVENTFEMVLRGQLEKGGILKFEEARNRVRDKAMEKKIAETRASHIEKLLAFSQTSYRIQPLQNLVVKLLIRYKEMPKYWWDPYRE